MSTRKARSLRPGAGDRRLRAEIEADVFEIWVGVSRLMSRLREPCAPFGVNRPAGAPAPRRRARTNRPKTPRLSP